MAWSNRAIPHLVEISVDHQVAYFVLQWFFVLFLKIKENYCNLNVAYHTYSLLSSGEASR